MSQLEHLMQGNRMRAVELTGEAVIAFSAEELSYTPGPQNVIEGTVRRGLILAAVYGYDHAAGDHWTTELVPYRVAKGILEVGKEMRTRLKERTDYFLQS